MLGQTRDTKQSNSGCLLTAMIVLLGFIPGGRAQVPASPTPYNLVSIVTDDQARWAVGAYGNREVQTPTMDRLADEGAIFSHAFVATPVCSPSRASFLTGQYASRLGIGDWIAPLEADAGLGIPESATLWPQVLQQHGYATALFGKWHLGTKPQFHPVHRGFDHFFGFLAGGNRPMDPTLEVGGGTRKLTGPLPDLLVDDAIRFIDSNRRRPFAVLLHFRAPHLPFGPVPQDDSAPFRDLDPSIPQEDGIDVEQVKRWTRDYYGSIHSIDRNIGRLLARLDDLDLSDNTIVLFTSDHGYMIGHHTVHSKGNSFWIGGGVRGPKRPNMFEHSIRVPLIIRWPGMVQPGTEIGEAVSNIDFFPSVLDMLNIPSPQSAAVDGKSFVPLLRDREIEWRDAIFGQYDLHNSGLAFMRMIRTAKWKLVRHYLANFLDEFYDLESDPGETTNLYRRREYEEIRNRLQRRLFQWQRSIDDPLLEGLPGITANQADQD